MRRLFEYHDVYEVAKLGRQLREERGILCVHDNVEHWLQTILEVPRIHSCSFGWRFLFLVLVLFFKFDSESRKKVRFQTTSGDNPFLLCFKDLGLGKKKGSWTGAWFFLLYPKKLVYILYVSTMSLSACQETVDISIVSLCFSVVDQTCKSSRLRNA